jgi:hypothetical protein
MEAQFLAATDKYEAKSSIVWADSTTGYSASDFSGSASCVGELRPARQSVRHDQRKQRPMKVAMIPFAARIATPQDGSS